MKVRDLLTKIDMINNFVKFKIVDKKGYVLQ